MFDRLRSASTQCSGIAGWRMLVREFAGNCAWLEIARLAWNLGKWIAMLALPDEVVRWE